MRNLFNLLLPLLMAGTSLDGSLYSIVTKKDDAILNKKYTKFIVVDEATHYVLAKTPAIYDASKEMPVNYFTLDFSDIVSSQQRLFTIHNLTDSNGGDEYDWVLEDNADENAIFFSRSNFVIQKPSMHWRMVVRGERVLLQNQRTGSYVKMNPDGSYAAVENEAEASHWKLIHIF